jgi:PAS domain S-box-containing protein
LSPAAITLSLTLGYMPDHKRTAAADAKKDVRRTEAPLKTGALQSAIFNMLEGEAGSRTADLVESERLYRSTFDAAPIGIVHTGLGGQWLRVNQRLCDLLGYSREELQTPAVQEHMQSEEAAGEAEAVRQMAVGTLDRHVVDEKRYRRRDGSFVWARVNMSVHRDAAAQPQYFIW